MHQVGTENPWSFRYSFEMMVDFCIWVLEKDGLQIPPFDVHPDGDGALRSVGLQAQEWRSWTAQVVQLQYQEYQVLSRELKVGVDPTPFFLADAHNPPASWSGNVGVRKHLDELWEQCDDSPRRNAGASRSSPTEQTRRGSFAKAPSEPAVGSISVGGLWH